MQKKITAFLLSKFKKNKKFINVNLEKTGEITFSLSSKVINTYFKKMTNKKICFQLFKKKFINICYDIVEPKTNKLENYYSIANANAVANIFKQTKKSHIILECCYWEKISNEMLDCRPLLINPEIYFNKNKIDNVLANHVFTNLKNFTIKDKKTTYIDLKQFVSDNNPVVIDSANQYTTFALDLTYYYIKKNFKYTNIITFYNSLHDTYYQ
jgi:hypothetical protein